MPRFTTPALLRVLLLGSLGFASEACSSSDSGGGSSDLDADASAGAGGETDGTGGHATSSGGQTSSAGGHAAGSGGDTIGAGGQTPGTGGQSPGAGGHTPGDGGSDAGAGGVWDDGGTTSAKGCTAPTPLIAGIETGIYTCSEGYLHRLSAHECGSRLPRDLAVTLPEGVTATPDECARDSDCTKENAFCTVVILPEHSCPNAPRSYQRICRNGCRVDADCGASAVCVCGADIGTCVAVDESAGCHTDADCEDGLCLSNANYGSFGPSKFGCQLPGDACDSLADCAPGPAYCAMAPTGRTCLPSPACGRPFLVERAPRLAGVVQSDAWLGVENLAAFELPTDPAVSRRLAQHWTDIALMEHASIAAFARFTLQLLALGAPAELVRDSTKAQADEMRHAALAFELAAAYGGAPVGPARLDLRGALDEASLEELLRTTIEEGCIGETRAALEAAEAARVATVPSVKALLEGIARDESAHAALAWRVVQWLLDAHPELAPLADTELARAAAPPFPSAPGAPNAALRAHGLLDEATLARLHSAAAREVIAPCARALLDVPRAA